MCPGPGAALTSIAGERVCTYLLGGVALMDTTSCKRRNRGGFSRLRWPARAPLDIPSGPVSDLLADDALLAVARHQKVSQVSDTGHNPRSHGGATVAPPSKAKSASVLTWDELASTATAGVIVRRRRA